jgi:hypothetical protein
VEQSAVIGDRNREEFEQLGQHDVLVLHEAWDLKKHRHAQEWLKEQKGIVGTRNRATLSRVMPMKLPDPLLTLRAMQRPKYDHMRVSPGQR